MTFLILSTLGYFLNALTILIDKFLVNKGIPNPLTYTFYLGLLSFTVLILLPFGFQIPSGWVLLLSCASGITFVFGWISFYYSLKFDEASRVAPIVGTLTAIFTFWLGLILFKQALSFGEIISVLVLILGLVMLSSSSWFKSKLEREHLLAMVISGFCFALSSVFLREVFLKSSFLNGLILSRLAMGFFVITWLFIPKIRSQLFHGQISSNHFQNQTSLLFIGGQIIGGLGGLLITFSISLVSPAIINSLAGTQYIFILIATLILGKRNRHLLDEDYTKHTLVHKILGSITIMVGLAILALSDGGFKL
ncbi:hypothetical protein HY025_04030 [Candidatus Daviesbacteria bacterium]|nr:hypothetical protein [Candidatus Daviesbacteria bacterium]